MGLPIFGMARVLDVEDLDVIALAPSQIAAAGFELKIEAAVARFALVVIKLDLAINAPVAIGRGSENVSGFAGGACRMAN